MKYCQGTRCHTYDTKDRKKVLRVIKEMKQENELLFIMAMATSVL